MSESKVIITGPGRSGTSFLIQLLTRLGLDTGFEPYAEPFYDNIRAGCEYEMEWFDLSDERKAESLAESPRILKAPEWCLGLKELLQKELHPVGHVIVPIRDLRDAARSRLEAGLHYLTDGTLDDQESVNAYLLGKCIEACELFDLPYTIMHFPRLVEDPHYCVGILSRILKGDVDYSKGIELHKELSKYKEKKCQVENQSNEVKLAYQTSCP
jgi:hypothetical protein